MGITCRKFHKMSDKKYRYNNGELTIVWQPSLCSHSGKCVKTLPQVYNPDVKPWITTGVATTDELIHQINLCPSGALSYEWNDKE